MAIVGRAGNDQPQQQHVNGGNDGWMVAVGGSVLFSAGQLGDFGNQNAKGRAICERRDTTHVCHLVGRSQHCPNATGGGGNILMRMK